MRLRNAAIGLILLAALAGCGSNSYGTGTGGGGGGGGGGPVGSVTVGAGIQFLSGHNGTHNPAVDTIAGGGTVTWTWGANSVPYGGGETALPWRADSCAGAGRARRRHVPRV